MGGRRHSGLTPIFFCQHLFDCLRKKFFLPCLNECSDDATTHAVKKAIPFDDESQKWSAAFDLAPGQCANGRASGVAGIRGEGLEIMFTHELGAGRAHQQQIQRARHVPRGRPKQRVHRRMIPDKITVLLAGRIETRVKFFPCSSRGNDPDIRRQPGIERQGQFWRRHFRFSWRNFEMRHHPHRVDPCIGPAGTVETGITGEQFGQSCFYFFLYAGADFLHLPAFVLRAIVGDDEFEFNHRGTEINLDEKMGNEFVRIRENFWPA